jgi:hypothetical protein
MATATSGEEFEVTIQRPLGIQLQEQVRTTSHPPLLHCQ